MTTTIRALLAVGAAGVLLAGCGGAPSATSTTPAGTSSSASTPTEAAPDTNTPEGKAEAWSIKFENLMADCMKAAGFQYVPHPQHYSRPAGNVAGKDPALVPYDVLKPYRQKYGYGAYYAGDVFPNDPNVVKPAAGPESNPNNAIRAGLDPARQQAYDQAFDGGARQQLTTASKKTDIKTGGCSDKIRKQLGNIDDGPAVTTDPTAQAAAALAEQQFTTDATVLAAAQDYGNCLRQHGYTVPSTKPGVIEHTLEQTVEQEHTNSPAVDKKQALTKEIKISLDDLECGKAYEAAAKPFVEKLLQVGVG
ncbi:hypothetical protein [Kutzneria sp. 744]|uniref:hypothetical protein n=1 Tax=Kutzneria sp. (strain 744) TaxID=345341 RepID=UPI0003EEB1F6|nr:hypothetical protein [Kutzneria sp. 744]EWM13264.1 basic proline-rich protein [Kutzneria sp. 744]